MDNKQNDSVPIGISSVLDILPTKAWFTLREACELKGVAYLTVCNKKELRPKGESPMRLLPEEMSGGETR